MKLRKPVSKEELVLYVSMLHDWFKQYLTPEEIISGLETEFGITVTMDELNGADIEMLDLDGEDVKLILEHNL